MINRRHLDIWLERACHLAAVGLSVIAAFLLKFDRSIPGALDTVVKQALLIAVLVKLPVFEWAGFTAVCGGWRACRICTWCFSATWLGSILFAAMSMLWIGVSCRGP